MGQSERSIPVVFGFSSNHGFNLPTTSAFHGFAGRKSLFDDLDDIEAMFGGLGLGGHSSRFQQPSHRPRSHSSPPPPPPQTTPKELKPHHPAACGPQAEEILI